MPARRLDPTKKLTPAERNLRHRQKRRVETVLYREALRMVAEQSDSEELRRVARLALGERE